MRDGALKYSTVFSTMEVKQAPRKAFFKVMVQYPIGTLPAPVRGAHMASWGDAQECEDLMARGVSGTGQGFDAPSSGRLGAGGFGGHNPSPAELRGKMLQVSKHARLLHLRVCAACQHMSKRIPWAPPTQPA